MPGHDGDEPVESHVIASHVVSPAVEYRMFVVLDPRHPVGPLASETPAGDWFVVTGQGGVLLCSGGNDFFPTVRVEVWDGTPPVSAEEWDESAETAFEAPSGTLRLTSVDSAPAGPDIDLGAAGGYQLRAYCRGRGEAMERLGVELYYRGVEEWLIQVWPGA